MLTQQKLKELLEYDEVTGVFTWRVDRKSVKAGDVAGCVDMPEGYHTIKVCGTKYRTARLAVVYTDGCIEEGLCVDHIDHNKTNNSRGNLRVVTTSENNRNMSKSSANTSGTVGVYYEADRDKWRVRLRVDGRNIHLGRYEDYELACLVRKEAQIKYGYHENHGE